MAIKRGDCVSPTNPSLGLPRGSVWRVACSAGALKLWPENAIARQVNRGVFDGCRFPTPDFDKVVLCRGQWVSVNSADFQNLSKIQTSTVSSAEANLTNAANATAAIEGLLEATRKLEAELQALHRKAAKLAKADKEAAAKATAEEAKRQLAARLYADRCLSEDLALALALIAEAFRLNNGGPEQVADASIAQHIDQLQALAKSYGYRIAKPSMLAQVVKL